MTRIVLLILMLVTSNLYAVSPADLIAHYKLNENTASDGDELVTNGHFTDWDSVATRVEDPTGWGVWNESGNDPEVSEAAADANHADTPILGGGMCNIYTSDGTGIYINQTITTVVGRKYRVSVNIDTVTAGGLTVYESLTQWTDVTYTTTGIKTFTFTAIATSFSLYVGRKYQVHSDVTFDDVSIKLCAAEDSSGNDHDAVIDFATPELVTNWDFANWTTDDPDDWTVEFEAGAGAPGTRDPEISQVATGQSHADAGGEAGGMCNLYSSSQGPIVSQNVTTVVGRTYQLSINFDTITTNKINVHNIGYDQWTAFTSDATGGHSVDFVCTHASTSLLIEDLSTPVDVTFDDVSMKLCGVDTADLHTTGKIDGCFDLDGSGDFIKVGDTASDVKSIAIWCNPDGVAGTDYLIDLNGTDYITIETGTVKVNGFAASTEVIYVDSVVSSTVTANWHFVVITATAGFTADDLDIGQLAGSGYFDGLIDNVMLFDTELTHSDVRYLYNSGRGREDWVSVDRLNRPFSSPFRRARYNF